MDSEYQAQIIVNIIKIFLKKVIFRGQTLFIPYSITKSRRSIDLSKNKSKKPNGGQCVGRSSRLSWTLQTSGLSFIKEIWRRNDDLDNQSTRRYRCGPLVELGDISDVSGHMGLGRGIPLSPVSPFAPGSLLTLRSLLPFRRLKDQFDINVWYE